MEVEDLNKLTVSQLTDLSKQLNIKKISALKKDDKVNYIFNYLKIFHQNYLESLKVTELNNLAKKYKIKNITGLKKKR